MLVTVTGISTRNRVLRRLVVLGVSISILRYSTLRYSILRYSILRYFTGTRAVPNTQFDRTGAGRIPKKDLMRMTEVTFGCVEGRAERRFRSFEDRCLALLRWLDIREPDP
jgi:hypothetical protein